MFDHFIYLLQQKLEGDLPGAVAQNKMSPNVRLTSNTLANYSTTRESGVLILLYIKNNELYIPFIQRPEYKGAHSAQVSLPGGKFEPYDNTLKDTALRETWEEIGVKPDRMQIVGNLSPIYIPNSNFNVMPYVAYVAECPTFTPDAFEVDYIIEAKLLELMAPETVQTFVKNINGHTIKAPFFNINNCKIWGATAMIISELKEIIRTMEAIPSGSCNAQNGPIYR
ncbi:8-oxo-dGTP pyrophosphatase MutT, NUDIX family [Saccharicrinis carchari]|uniref:8-oxo-dGTP pyrophosphatase MutT, NUDIX family n=1 Tax=Saccharicrinis carchari TaxID=1168039 RepID=A0A521ADR1_SACCC|nr:CoA pyrophosphatase [Saccharicrinis carchari]SMO32908.1 8-oxo-dGTP pyrophosphatase MutT, NUDIX family [Saccharicrinis carchari]